MADSVLCTQRAEYGGYQKTPSARQGRKARVKAHLRGTTLFRRYLATTTSLGANTPALVNGSTRWQLLTSSGTFHHHGSRGSFRLPLILTCTSRQLSVIAANLTFLAQCLITTCYF